jgi:hypothetical protein
LNTTFIDALTEESGTYTPPGASGLNHYYRRFVLLFETEGEYVARTISSIDLYLYIYSGAFDPANPSTDLLMQNDDAAGNLQSLLTFSVAAGTLYEVIVTTYSELLLGNFTLFFSGPDYVVIQLWQRECNEKLDREGGRITCIVHSRLVDLMRICLTCLSSV